MDEKLKCWHCGSENLLNTPTMENPLEYHGDKLMFTVCKDCWGVNEFVNGKSARIVFDFRYLDLKDSEDKAVSLGFNSLDEMVSQSKKFTDIKN